MTNENDLISRIKEYINIKKEDLFQLALEGELPSFLLL